jgi:hypothetical protein
MFCLKYMKNPAKVLDEMGIFYNYKGISIMTHRVPE